MLVFTSLRKLILHLSLWKQLFIATIKNTSIVAINYLGLMACKVTRG